MDPSPIETAASDDEIDERERRLTAHLHRAGELLRGEDVGGAEREVTSALELGSDDVRARNLLGLVRFRGGRYEEALKLFHELVMKDPEDPSLRLNLGLVELRMGKHDEAAADLRRVVEKEPRNLRAHSYLGLALLRAGDLVHARRAFLDANQEDMARQVEERIALAADEAERSVSEVRRIAEVGLKAFEEKEHPFAAIDVDEEPRAADREEAEKGTWQVRQAGAPAPDPVPAEGLRVGMHIAPLRLEAAIPVAEFAAGRLLPAGLLGEPFAIAESGMLVLRIEGRLPARTVGAIVSAGQLTFEPLCRRVRGRITTEPFGEGVEALSVAVGRGVICVAPRGATFTALALRDDIVYLREAVVFAFEESLHWENGRVPGGGAAGVPVVQFRGTGRCVVRSLRDPFTVKMEPGDTMYVDEGVLIGWIGRVVPRQLHDAEGNPTPYIECSGEGALILEEPDPAPQPLQQQQQQQQQPVAAPADPAPTPPADAADPTPTQ